jgi:hypothetical protein
MHQKSAASCLRGEREASLTKPEPALVMVVAEMEAFLVAGHACTRGSDTPRYVSRSQRCAAGAADAKEVGKARAARGCDAGRRSGSEIRCDS